MAVNSCGLVSIDGENRELAAHGTALFPVACYDDNISDEEVLWHWHEEAEVLTVISGTIRNNINGNNIIVNKGEGLFINGGVLHGMWPQGTEACRLHSIVFHPRLVGGSVDSILWQKYVEPLITDASLPCLLLHGGEGWKEETIRRIEGAWLACAGEEEGFEFAVREQLSQMMFLLCKHCHAGEKKPSEKNLRSGERVKKMLQYIGENVGEPLTLGRIAESAAVSENECLRCFRIIIGCTPMQYVRQLRIQRAADLLARTDNRISDIGAQCGFQEMSYFAKLFREEKGCTPGEYRRNAQACREMGKP